MVLVLYSRTDLPLNLNSKKDDVIIFLVSKKGGAKC